MLFNNLDETKKPFPLLSNTLSLKVIPREIAEEVYKEYQLKFGDTQSLETIERRGGFSPEEVIWFLYDKIQRLKIK